MNMGWKNRFWKYATAFFVVLILLNPEMVAFALFIDAIGLEMFLLLLEIQIFAVFAGLFSLKTKMILSQSFQYMRCVLPFKQNVSRDLPSNFLLFSPSQATLMHLVVFSSMMGIAFHASF